MAQTKNLLIFGGTSKQKLSELGCYTALPGALGVLNPDHQSGMKLGKEMTLLDECRAEHSHDHRTPGQGLWFVKAKESRYKSFCKTTVIMVKYVVFILMVVVRLEERSVLR